VIVWYNLLVKKHYLKHNNSQQGIDGVRMDKVVMHLSRRLFPFACN